MLFAHLDSLVDSKRPCSVDSIRDFSSIHIVIAQLLEHLINLLLALKGKKMSRNALKTVEPELLANLAGRREILKGEVDAGANGGIKDRNTIRGEEHDSMEVLKLMQKRSNKTVMLELVCRTDLEEDIRFVDQDDSLPDSCEAKKLPDLAGEGIDIVAELASRDLQDRPL